MINECRLHAPLHVGDHPYDHSVNITMTELMELRDAATEHIQQPDAHPHDVAYHKGSAFAVRDVLWSAAAGQPRTFIELQETLAGLEARARQPWNTRYLAYWSGAIAMTQHILTRWQTTGSA